VKMLWRRVFPLTLIALLISCNGANHRDQIKTRILHERQEKDRYFLANENSPLSGEEKSRFDGLQYFPVDLNYRFVATFHPYSSVDTIVMAAGKDHRRPFLRWGEFEFSVNGHRGKLHVYKPLKVDDGYHPYYFIPFYDQTNGAQTYGGGRYLDVPVRDTHKYVIDFNRAYNPYCAYDADRWVCPLPPQENALDFAIQAGEKIPQM